MKDNAILMTFSGIVKKMGRRPEEKFYTVVFRRQAAFYSIDKKLNGAVELLSKSVKENVSVKVTHDAVTREITSVEEDDGE